MKLSFLLVLAASLQVSARVNGQGTISLKLKNTEISKALGSIEKEGTYRFLYNSRLKDLNQKVTMEISNATVSETLSKIFAGKDLSYKMMENNLIVIMSANASMQDTAITGKITGASGEALANVSVTVKGTSRGTVTNNNGEFTLTVPDNASLVISYIGYQSQTVSVAGQTTFNISLATSTNTMDQVVVVGYGTQRRSDLTGSVASVRGAEIAKIPVLTATQAIQGKVAGVQIISSGDPNSSPTVRIRGVGTMLGGANPLYVVDGVITDDIRNINSADILSLDVLKDASSTAIYGMRAANGVLLITTKKGRVGKMVIAYDGTMGVKSIGHLVDMAGPQQYANYVNEANIFYGDGDTLVTRAQLNAGGNTDWFDAILKRSFQQNHNVSLSGGSDKINYFLSAGYITDGGIIKTNDFKRFTLRSNNEYKITNNFRLSTLISYSRVDTRDVNLDNFNLAYRAAPYITPLKNGLYGNTSLANNVGNPLLNLNEVNNAGLGNRLEGTFAADYKPVSWLTLHSSFGVDLNFFKGTLYDYAYANSGPSNVFAETGGNQIANRSSLQVNRDNYTKWVWDNTATFQKAFGKHNLSLLVGTTAEEYTFDGLQGTVLDVPGNKDQWFLDAGDPTTAKNINSGDKWSRNSYLGRFNYNYDNRYLLTATFRADATSRFPVQNRWGYFPSAGIAWNINNEAFMQGNKVFSTLKLRGSAGRVGNDQIASNLYNPLASLNVPYFFDGTAYRGISFDQVADPNLKWETTTEYDGGIDFGILGNKLTGTIDLYSKKTTNALINIGFNGQYLGDLDNTYTTNAATFTNKGVEFGLNWNDRVGTDWNYTIGGNIAFNQNKIVGLNGGQALFGGDFNGFVTKSDNGHEIGAFFLRQDIGIFQNQAQIDASAQKDAKPGDVIYKDISGPNGKPDGIIDDNDRTYSGSYQPKFTYGINGSVSYKTIDFSFNTYGTYGGKIYNAKKAIRGADLRDNLEASVAKGRWTVNNPSTTIPRASQGEALPSTYFLEGASFWRINNLTLGYTLPKPFLTRAKFQNLRIFVSVQNLATVTHYSGFTPELVPGNSVNANGTVAAPSNLTGGIEQAIYPTTRTYLAGVNFSF